MTAAKQKSNGKQEQDADNLDFSEMKTRDLADKIDEINRHIENYNDSIRRLEDQRDDIKDILALRLGLDQPAPMRRASVPKAPSSGTRHRASHEEQEMILGKVPDIVPRGGIKGPELYRLACDKMDIQMGEQTFKSKYLSALRDDGKLITVGDKVKMRYFLPSDEKAAKAYADSLQK